MVTFIKLMLADKKTEQVIALDSIEAFRPDQRHGEPITSVRTKSGMYFEVAMEFNEFVKFLTSDCPVPDENTLSIVALP